MRQYQVAFSCVGRAGGSLLPTFQQLMEKQILQGVARGRIVWIDEAEFLSTKQMSWAVDFARANVCRLILSADSRQHRSVDRATLYVS